MSNENNKMSDTTKYMIGFLATIVMILIGITGTMISAKVSDSDNEVTQIIEKVGDLTRSIDANTAQLEYNAGLAQANNNEIKIIQNTLRDRDVTVRTAEENEVRLTILEAELAKGGRYTLEEHLTYAKETLTSINELRTEIALSKQRESVMNDRIADLEGRYTGN